MKRGYRIIRRVVKTDKKGRPKVARDRKTGIDMERVTARTQQPCARGIHCPHGGLIFGGTEYAKVSDMNKARRMGGAFIPDVKDYHFECVPPEARPLVRFLVHPEQDHQSRRRSQHDTD
jgi:hypothetical protein